MKKKIIDKIQKYDKPVFIRLLLKKVLIQLYNQNFNHLYLF